MNYLFILLGFDSFYEAMIMLKMIDQLPPGCNILVYASPLAATYLEGDQRVYLMPLSEDLQENKKIFDQSINEGELTSVFVFDYHKTLFTKDYHHNYVIIPFNPTWLDDLEIPVCIIDCYDMFNFNENDNLYLMDSNKFNVEDEPVDTERSEYDEVYSRALLGDNPHNLETEDIEFEQSEYVKPEMIVKTDIYPYIIKPCPPCESSKDKTDERFIYWNYSTTDFSDSETEKMKVPLGYQPDRKNIVVNFSYQFILKSAVTNLESHYKRVMDSLIIFLKKLDLKINLYVIGMNSNLNQDPLLRGSKITVKAFRDPNYNIYKTLMSFADLVITDTTWHPCLVDAACLKIPAGVIGNSMKILKDGTCQASYSNTDIEVFKELEKAIAQAPQTIFPYSSFPLKESEAPYFGFYEEKYLYYLLDIYSEESVLNFLYEFLNSDEEIYNKLLDRFAEYKKRAEHALKTEQLIFFFEGYET